VIKSFKHKGLQRLYTAGSAAGVRPEHQKRLRIQLAALDTAQVIEDMDIPGFRLHPLKGDRRGQWAIEVSRNWRLVFKFADGNAFDVDYEDYH
jgi:toxin HigB-1